LDKFWRDFLDTPTRELLDEILLALNSEERSDAFISLFENVEQDNLFWSGLAEWWNTFDAIDHVALGKLMRRRASTWTPECMSEENRCKYDALPDRFTVYRGQDLGRHGYSWTLDVKVAEGFARGHRGIKNPHPVSVTAKTKKSNVAFYQGDRQESEIVPLRRPTINVEVSRLLYKIETPK
jgi:hypothetical protein